MIEPYEDARPEIDPAAYVHSHACLIGQVRIGAQTSVWPGAVLRGDVGPITIGAQTSIQDNSAVHTTGGKSVTVIGDRVTVGHRVILHGCRVDDDCIVGMGAIVMDNAHIPAWTLVGAGALVPPGKSYPSGKLLLGSPARPVRDLTSAERAWITESWKVYVGLAEKYRARDAA